MTKMTTINYRLLTDGERLEMLAHLIVVLQKFAVADNYITLLIMSFQEGEKRLKASMARQAANILSSEIDDLDFSRGKLLTSIRSGVRYFMDKNNAEQSAAATRLKLMYDNCVKGLNLSSNSEESVAIGNIVEKLKEPVVQADITILQLSEDFVALEEVQTRFNELITDRAIMEESDETPRIKTSRRAIYSDIKTLREILHFQSRSGNSEYDDLITEMNGRIGEIMAVAKGRQTAKQQSVS